ncbi:MAG TPA: PAS domain S-box protein, partial [Nocardioidaceae bacterium]|nr:PAS domain S-box protein [Nocardioidaceae bacterium]
AVVHAGTPIGLSVQVAGGRLRVEVQDGSPHLPERREQAPLAGFGRGLVLIEDVVDAWGVSRGSRGKTVWFEIGRPVAPREQPSRQLDHEGTSPPAPPPLTVQLLHTPLVLYAAWQPHAETLLREYLLVRAGDDPALAVAEHARAHDAVVLLQEAVPAVTIGPRSLLEDPDGDAARHTDVLLRVPAGSLDSFALLDRLLDEAGREMGSSPGLLTAPVPVELQQLRGWLCWEVLRQSRGMAPTPWWMQEPDRVPGGLPIREVDEVTASPLSLLLVDESAYIVAVSGPFAALLGYAAVDLAGRHVHTIIPARLREGHAAGFALHQLTGRDVLLTGEVTVPALRADGTEMGLHGEIRRRIASDGRPVFLAQLGATAAG